MSLATTIGTGTLLGGLLAAGIYAAAAPSDEARASVPVSPTFGAVPTPTRTVPAPCAAGARLDHGTCVITVPGRTIAPPVQSESRSTAATTHRATTGTSRPVAQPTTGDDHGDDHDGDEPGDDHGGDDHDDD